MKNYNVERWTGKGWEHVFSAPAKSKAVATMDRLPDVSPSRPVRIITRDWAGAHEHYRRTH